jgi:putative membrane protein
VNVPEQVPSRPGQAQFEAKPIDDSLFAGAAAVAGMTELETAKLAEQQAAHEEVRQFARRMYEDHTRASKELMTIVGEKDISTPRDVSVREKACLNILSGLAGPMFDRAYIDGQVVAHMEAVALFEAEAQRGRDTELRAFAGRRLPTLQEHLRQVQMLASTHGTQNRGAVPGGVAPNPNRGGVAPAPVPAPPIPPRGTETRKPVGPGNTRDR